MKVAREVRGQKESKEDKREDSRVEEASSVDRREEMLEKRQQMRRE